MALPFLKSSPVPRKSSPVDRVKELTGRGFQEGEIVDVLRKEGYSPQETDIALTQVLRQRATESSPPPLPWEIHSTSEQRLPTLEELTAEKKQATMPEMPETPLPQEYYQQNYLTEEYVDYIVQARLGEFTQKMTEFYATTQELSRRTEQINNRINEIMTIRNSEQTQILSKIDSFRESVEEIEARISGLEKAFKDTLPALIESVRALTDLVHRFKKEI